ncbi:MAG: Trm112 family protein [Thermoguttaceae bacterium]
MIDPDLLDILVCPETRTRLRLAEPSLVARLNQAIAGQRLANRAGQPVRSPIDGGLVREDGTLLYPIVEGIPVLLVDEAIPLEQLEQPHGRQDHFQEDH